MRGFFPTPKKKKKQIQVSRHNLSIGNDQNESISIDIFSPVSDSQLYKRFLVKKTIDSKKNMKTCRMI